MKNAYQFNIEKMQEVTPSMSFTGGDLAAWKAVAREKLSELLGMSQYEFCPTDLSVELDEQQDGFREIRFTFESEPGYRVPCHLWLPDGIENPPVLICMQGHSTGMHISMGRPKYPGDAETINGGDRDFCRRAIKEGFAAVALEQRNFGETKGNGGCVNSALTALLHGRTTVGERVHDVMQLITVLENHFAAEVDTKNICCMGTSGGGTTTAYVAALEDRVALAMISCAMCTYKDSIGAMPHCACNFVPHIAEYFDMNDLMAMAAPKYFIQVSGKEDEIFPIAPATAVFEKGREAYKLLEAEDRCVMVVGNGGHRFYADPAWPWVHKFIK